MQREHVPPGHARDSVWQLVRNAPGGCSVVEYAGTPGCGRPVAGEVEGRLYCALHDPDATRASVLEHAKHKKASSGGAP